MNLLVNLIFLILVLRLSFEKRVMHMVNINSIIKLPLGQGVRITKD